MLKKHLYRDENIHEKEKFVYLYNEEVCGYHKIKNMIKLQMDVVYHYESIAFGRTMYILISIVREREII